MDINHKITIQNATEFEAQKEWWFFNLNLFLLFILFSFILFYKSD